jgi:hypothetical protein
MSESVAESKDWVKDPKLGNLYVLYVDGIATASTALVDRSDSRGEQISELAQIDWLPPQQMSATYETIVQANHSEPTGAHLDGDRRYNPLRGGFGATIDCDQPVHHPVRDYLFPNLERSGSLALDAGESVISTWKSFKPRLAGRKQEGGVRVTSRTHVPYSELRDCVGILTNRRLVFHGRLHFAVAVREDYPSIFLPPVLFESIATFRQIKRWSTRDNLHWGFHVRHEWTSEVVGGSIPDRKKPVLAANDQTQFLECGIPLLPHSTALFRIPFRGDELVGNQANECIEAIRSAEPRRVISGPIEAKRTLPSSKVFSKKTEEEVTSTWKIAGAVPWTLPPTF